MEARFYVYQADGHHVGPLAADELASGIAQGKIRRDAYAGAVGDARWQPILEIGAVSQALERASRPSQPPRSPMNTIPPAPAPPPDAPVTDPDITAAFRRDDARDGAPLPQYPLSSSSTRVARAGSSADDTTRVSAQAPLSKSDAKATPKEAANEDSKAAAEHKSAFLDPKLRLMVPLGVFGAFVALAFFLFLVGLIANPDPSSSTGGPTGTGALAPRAK
jgi:hypothetical protein